MKLTFVDEPPEDYCLLTCGLVTLMGLCSGVLTWMMVTEHCSLPGQSWPSLSSARSWLRALRSGSGPSLSLALSTSPPLPPSCSSVTPRHSSAGPAPGDPGTSSLDVTMGMVFLLKWHECLIWFLSNKQGELKSSVLVSGQLFLMGPHFAECWAGVFTETEELCKYDRGIVMGITHTAYKSFSLKNGRILPKYSTFTICVEHSISTLNFLLQPFLLN